MSDEGKLAEVIDLGDFRASKTKTRPAPSESQIIAMERKLAGESCEEAAKAAGVSVETLHKWMGEDPTFINEMQNRHEEDWDNTLMMVNEIAQTSIANILKAISSGDVSASKWFLEKCILDDVDKSEFSSTDAFPFTFQGILAGFADAEGDQRIERTKKGLFSFLKSRGDKK